MSPTRRPAESISRSLLFVSLAAVLLLAGFFRLQGLRWDAACSADKAMEDAVCTETHLHPDERFLTMVATGVELPDSFAEYLDTERSPTNPHNRGYGFFPYGLFPVLSVKTIATGFNLAGYDQIHLVGRAVSAVCSLLTVGLLFVLGSRLYDPLVGLMAALLLTLAVLPIQQAHFFTVDSMATAASMLTLLFAVGIAKHARWRDFFFFGLALGVAVAVKVSVATLAVLAVAATLVRAHNQRSPPSTPHSKRQPLAAGLALAAVVSLITFRLLNPYAFSGPGILGVGLNPEWLANMQEVGQLVGGWLDFPPGHQWTDRTALWFPWKNMVLVGLGPALGVVGWVGWVVAGVLLVRRGQQQHLLPWLWVAILFTHQGTQWVKSLRYLLPIYPALALLAAFLLVEAWRRARRSGRTLAKVGAAALVGFVLVASLAWTWAFTAIYRHPHSRVEASRWIYQNVPEGSGIAHETWDDALPIPLDDMPGLTRYRDLPLHPYAEDSPQKLTEMLDTLDQADFLVLSSNRLYDSIPRLPMRYPMTIRYYEALFSGELGFERVAEFTSYPRLFGISIPDQGAEEAFSVYDHPRVQIFARTAQWNRIKARAILDTGDWEQILQLTPREARRYQDLELAAERLDQQQRGGTWMLQGEEGQPGAAKSLFPQGRSPWVSLLLWMLCLEWLGLVAFPLAAPAFRGLVDRGWLLSKTVGLLIVSYVAWVAGSLGWLAFSPTTLRWLMVLFTAAALAAGWKARQELADFARHRWRLLLTEEALFWGCFGLFLLIRYLNPDLWHPFRGGEKPMDLAYFNAVVRSTFFPPYDPWFAGGALNYYYFGFVLSGSLSLLARVPTAVAYNLAVPTFFALTAAGALTAARALTAEGPPGRGRSFGSLTWGLVGAAIVLLVGNQGLARLFAERLSRLSEIDFASHIPFLPDLVRLLDGTLRWVSGVSIGIEDHWLYWSPSRSIPHPPSEPSPITEFPLFTFLFGDLHAHLMAMPIALLTIAALIGLVRRGRDETARPSSPWRRILEETSVLAGLALAVGALAAINTWDLPTLLGITGLALLIRELQRNEPARALAQATWRFGLVAIGGRLLYLPFHSHFVPGYGRIERWQGSQTPVSSFLIIHALFLLPILTWLLIERRPWQSAARERALSGSLDRIFEFWGLGLAAGLAVFGLHLEAMLVVVIALSAGLALAPRQGGRARLVASFVLTGSLLALAVEHLRLAGDIGRMNTVFKIYLQIWVLWGLSATFALAALSRRWRVLERRIQGNGVPTWGKAVVCLWLLLLTGAVAYPLLAIPARIRDRFENSTQRGLDGRTFMASAIYGDENGPIELRWDGEAIRWLDENIQGSPVVLEASTPIYRWGSRISVHTGLPTVLGWDWHQQQQRVILKNDPIGRRRQDVATMFGASSTEEILPLLRRYRIRYIVVGKLERLTYPESGIDKFARGGLFMEVYRNPEVVIYEVDQTALSG